MVPELNNVERLFVLYERKIGVGVRRRNFINGLDLKVSGIRSPCSAVDIISVKIGQNESTKRRSESDVLNNEPFVVAVEAKVTCGQWIIY